MPKMADTYRNRILVKMAQMVVLRKKYEKAMLAGERAIEKIASEYQARQASYRKVLEGLKAQRKGSRQ